MQQPPRQPRKPSAQPGRSPYSEARPSQGQRRRPTPQQMEKIRQRRKAKKRKRFLFLTGVALVLIVIIALIVALMRSIFAPKAPSSVTIHSISSSASISASSSSQYVVQPVGNYVEEDIPMLVRKDRPLPQGYSPELASIGTDAYGSTSQMDTRAATAYKAMAEAAQEDGIYFTIISAFRYHETQVRNYENSIQSYISQGYTQEDAETATQRYFAVPGTSEHELGMAVDIDSLEESFENTSTFAWLSEHCADYGFILRYEKSTEDITGIAYEPWHYRYVGTNHAHAIKELGITLDEYVIMLESQKIT